MRHLMALMLTVLAWQIFITDAQAEHAFCRSEMRNYRGHVIEVFFGESRYGMRDACREAMWECRDELDWRQRRGQNPYATCHLANNNDPGRDRVTRSCDVYRYGPRGRYLQRHTAHATGRRGDVNLYRRACARAMKMCEAQRRGREYCQRPY